MILMILQTKKVSADYLAELEACKKTTIIHNCFVYGNVAFSGKTEEVSGDVQSNSVYFAVNKLVVALGLSKEAHKNGTSFSDLILSNSNACLGKVYYWNNNSYNMHEQSCLMDDESFCSPCSEPSDDVSELSDVVKTLNNNQQYADYSTSTFWETSSFQLYDETFDPNVNTFDEDEENSQVSWHTLPVLTIHGLSLDED